MLNMDMKRMCYTWVMAIFFLSACDNREEQVDSFNDAPYFALETDTVSAISDSLKLSQNQYPITPTIIDANDNIIRIAFAGNTQGRFQVDGERVAGGAIEVKSIPTSITYHPTLSGAHIFTITAIDAFGLSADLKVQLTAFVNIPPTLVVDIVKPNGSGPFERILDASGSFDPDQRFGGSIVEYEYSFLNKVVSG